MNILIPYVLLCVRDVRLKALQTFKNKLGLGFMKPLVLV